MGDVEEKWMIAVGVDEVGGGGGQFHFAFTSFAGGRGGDGATGMDGLKPLGGGAEGGVAEMPFAEAGGGVPGLAQEFGDGDFFERELSFDAWGPEFLGWGIGASRQVGGEVQAGGVFAGEQGGSRG
jgi:hypothetical protein